MEKIINKEEAITRKKEGIRSVNKLLEMYINSDNPKLYKKAFNISTWLKAYANYLHFEEIFQPTKNIAYKRGEVVKVNLGFKVGNELGGIHYAVVLDNHNKHSSSMITIIPLSSFKDKVYERDVDLGNDLYRQLNKKLTMLEKNAYSEKEKLDSLFFIIENAASMCDSQNKINSNEIEKIQEAVKQISSHQEALLNKINLFKAMQKEIERMKKGSIAKIEQITSVSKMRILDPKQTGDVLHNISLSNSSMDKINIKIHELFIQGFSSK